MTHELGETKRYWRMNSIMGIRMELQGCQYPFPDPEYKERIERFRIELVELLTEENRVRGRFARIANRSLDRLKGEIGSIQTEIRGLSDPFPDPDDKEYLNSLRVVLQSKTEFVALLSGRVNRLLSEAVTV